VVQIVREERNENRRHTTDFVTRLLDSGAIDKWDIDDQVRATLDWLKESTQRVIRQNDAPAFPPPQEGDALPQAELPTPPLPGHADPPTTSTHRPPRRPDR
jgi:hypothetical protein